MKARILLTILFLMINASCAMQEYKIPSPHARNHAPHHHHQHTPEVIVIEMPQVVAQPSPHTEEMRYNRKKKLALIGMITTALAGGTAVIVFLTK